MYSIRRTGHCCKLYTMRKWITAQLNVIAVTGFISLSPGSPTQCLNQLSYLPTPSWKWGDTTHSIKGYAINEETCAKMQQANWTTWRSNNHKGSITLSQNWLQMDTQKWSIAQSFGICWHAKDLPLGRLYRAASLGHQAAGTMTCYEKYQFLSLWFDSTRFRTRRLQIPTCNLQIPRSPRRGGRRSTHSATQ